MKIQAIGRKIFDQKEVDQRAADIYDLFKERIKEFRKLNPLVDLKFNVSGTAPYHQVFIVGNKKVGSNYDMNMWKDVPIYQSESRSFIDGGNWLSLRINFRGSSGGDDGHSYDQDGLTKIIDKALTNAVNDFVETPENTL